MYSTSLDRRALAALDAWITRPDDRPEIPDDDRMTHCYLCFKPLAESAASYMETETEGDVPCHAECLQEHLIELKETEQ